jgi:hypothetical protein
LPFDDQIDCFRALSVSPPLEYEKNASIGGVNSPPCGAIAPQSSP